MTKIEYSFNNLLTQNQNIRKYLICLGRNVLKIYLWIMTRILLSILQRYRYTNMTYTWYQQACTIINEVLYSINSFVVNKKSELKLISYYE